MKILETVIYKPVTILMLILAILLIGGISYSKISLELMPDTTSSWLSIEVRYPNMSPYTIEEIIIQPIEDKISEIGGIKNIFSIASEGDAKINIEFLPEVNIKKAGVSVRQKIELIRNKLPKEANEPEINHYNPSETPIIIATLKGAELNYLREFAENYVKRKIERVEGVSNIIVSGGRVREIEVNVDLSKLKAYSIGIDAIGDAIQKSNIDMPLGKIRLNEDEIGVSFLGKIRKVSEMNEVGIILSENKFIKLRQLAEVKDGSKEEESIARENGEEKISLYIQKTSGANTIQVAEEIERNIASLNLPKNVLVEISYNQANYIKEALDRVKEAGYLGIMIAMLVIFIFLRNIKDTLIVGFAIPLSLFITLTCMYLLKIKLNIMTLSGMVLGIGLLVDNTIVVLNSIKTQKNIINGVRSVMTPIVASTLCTIVVFFPLIFIDVTTRRLYGDFSLVITFSILSSLLVAIFVVPNLIHNLKINTTLDSFAFFKKIKEKINPFNLNLVLKYKKILLKSLKNKTKILIGTAVLIGLTVFLLTRLNEKGGNFLNTNTVNTDINFTSGMVLEKANSITKEIEKELGSIPYVKKITTKIEKEKSTLNLELDELKLEGIKLDKVVKDLNVKYSTYRNATVRFSYGEDTKENNEITIELVGDRIPEMKELSMVIAKKIKEIPSMTSVLFRYKEPRPELEIILDKNKLAQYQITTLDVAHTIKNYIAGSVVTKYVDDEKQIDVTVKLMDPERKNIDNLKNLLIHSPKGFQITLENIARINESSSEPKIYRKNKRRMVAISGYFDNTDLFKIIQEIKETIKTIPLPEDIGVIFGEDYKEMKTNQKNILSAVVLSFLFVFMVLASLYESYILPFIIITSVPLAFIGVILYMFVFKISLSMSVYIGMIVLIGIVVNNGIILVDEMRVKSRHFSTILTIFNACQSRLRPVLMTALTTSLSLLPIALDNSTGAEMWSSLARTIIIGLLNSTLLTFIIIPLFFSYLGLRKKIE